MPTFAQFKDQIRRQVWPSGEPENLVDRHDSWFIEAMVDLQRMVECLQIENTSLFPHCSTLYNCGLTVFDMPPGEIVSVTVIDKINPITHREDADSPDDYCKAIVYPQIDGCYIRDFLTMGRRMGCCPSIPWFFGFNPLLCGKAAYPVPTDEGVPAGLPVLPLGYYYPQESTDRNHGRSRVGVFALMNGRVYLAPWIQSTETVIVKWNGVKRIWLDGDPVTDDPQFADAVTNYIWWKTKRDDDKELELSDRLLADYNDARAGLMHDCDMRMRVRECHPSRASGAISRLTALFYNDVQTASASCPDGTGTVTATIPEGSVGSSVSKADANARALAQAQDQANAKLDCTVIYWNDQVTRTASCEGEEGAPAPQGDPVTVTIPANTVSSEISKDDANTLAAAQALAQAQAGLSCIYFNAEQTYEGTCADDSPVSATVAAGTVQSTISQADADDRAQQLAQSNAKAGCPAAVTNTAQSVHISALCNRSNPGAGSYTLTITVAAGRFTGTDQNDANLQAIHAANVYALQYASTHDNLTCNALTIPLP